ncbi:MAG: phosphate signaling complex protein PhoU [Gemmatimonadota bacterium]|nr:MAG: phosphate signaling complex protein PhoU [Gemmatimonadota bacterium]
MPEARHFHEELAELKNKLLVMSSLVEASIQKSIQALEERSPTLAREVFDDDKVIDQMEIEIDECGIRLMALDQPVAVDLRMLFGVLRINNDLERIGDHSVNIAERALRLAEAPFLKQLVDIPRMAAIVQSMVKDVLDGFVQEDPEKARATCKRDDEVDELDDRFIRALLTYMMEKPSVITQAMDLIIISKNLERIGDLATNIAEDVVFIYQAKTIKHHIDKKED